MKVKETKTSQLVPVMELRYGHQMVSNGYIVEKVDTALKPMQSLETDAMSRTIGVWDDRMYHRIILADSRSSRRLYLFPQLCIGLLVDPQGRIIQETQVNDRYEVVEFFK
ncbi:MAG: hypothetical protein KAG66_11720 [Methylococcales bacterium]|nr:hypothetical protein [Methylococcales bacterium]